jgi:hypothetical protein
MAPRHRWHVEVLLLPTTLRLVRAARPVLPVLPVVRRVLVRDWCRRVLWQAPLGTPVFAHGHRMWLLAPRSVTPDRMSDKRGKNDAVDVSAVVAWCGSAIRHRQVCGRSRRHEGSMATAFVHKFLTQAASARSGRT